MLVTTFLWNTNFVDLNVFDSLLHNKLNGLNRFLKIKNVFDFFFEVSPFFFLSQIRAWEFYFRNPEGQKEFFVLFEKLNKELTG